MRHLALRCSPWMLALCSWLVAAQARADVISPEEEACEEVGTACNVDGQDGACQAEKCWGNDYSNMEADDTPGTREYDCVKCIVGTTPAAITPEPEVEERPTPEPEASEPPKGGPEPVATTKGTRCAVEPTSTSMLSFALGLGLLGLVARRRRR